MAHLSEEEINELAKEHVNSFTQLSEIEGVIIRGHILIERSLSKAIELSVIHTNEYLAERFTFSQKFIIANMLGISNLFKLEIGALNKLRNQIAHSLAYDSTLINQIIIEVNRKQNKQVVLNNKNTIPYLKSSISFICGALSVSHNIAREKFWIAGIKEQIDNQ